MVSGPFGVEFKPEPRFRITQLARSKNLRWTGAEKTASVC